MMTNDRYTSWGSHTVNGCPVFVIKLLLHLVRTSIMMETINFTHKRRYHTQHFVNISRKRTIRSLEHLRGTDPFTFQPSVDMTFSAGGGFSKLEFPTLQEFLLILGIMLFCS